MTATEVEPAPIETAPPPALDHWIIIPWLNNPQMTAGALTDALAQFGGSARVLLISSGVSAADREWMEGEIADYGDRVLPWWHNPQLPSLSAKWNAGLRFVWATGATEAMVCNADLRMRPDTYSRLRERLLADGALFVSGVGVTEEQYLGSAAMANDSKGGPDFSCYVISKECHEKYPFDEGFIPAFTEDCSAHRMMMLGGDGARVFSIDLPYHHVDKGSGTLKSMNPEQRALVEWQITNVSRVHYAALWGGGVNEETFLVPGGGAPEQEAALLAEWGGTTTQHLFGRIREGWRAQGQ